MKAHELINKADCLIIKIGTVLVIDHDKDDVRHDWIDALAEDIKTLTDHGKKIVIVSSGAIALGRNALDIPHDVAPETIRLEQKQAASAVGQFHLFNQYYQSFQKHRLTAAQVLITMAETENRRMHLNARETLNTLMDKGIVPIVNENDAVSTGEIRFGDNDRLAARIGQMIEADTVVLLSTADGLYTDNPDKNNEAEHIPLVKKITDDHIKMAGEAVPGLSTGGMKSKVEAAQTSVRAGIPLIITDGTDLHPLSKLGEEDKRSTVFAAEDTNANARKKWLQAHMNPKGSVTVDEGAFKALKSGKSLLPIGVKEVEGDFERGDPITIKSPEGDEIGIGLSAYSSADAIKIIGKQSSEIQNILGYAGRDELIHRNDMVLSN